MARIRNARVGSSHDTTSTMSFYHRFLSHGASIPPDCHAYSNSDSEGSCVERYTAQNESSRGIQMAYPVVRDCGDTSAGVRRHTEGAGNLESENE
jgi:hypothetical protein